MKTHSIRAVTFAALLIFLSATTASAYWVWTPETKKFLNPKYAVKDSPKEQYDWAMTFYDAKDYPRAITEFDKLTKSYEFSEYAGMAQYHIGLCYENMGKYYLAFQAYQKAIENFPHLDNVDEIIAREFNIANIYSAKENPKVLGTDIMTPTDRVVEIYRKIVDNAPYGKLADESLFNMGAALKTAERYDEAIPAFQKILDEYPDSKFTERARYEVAYCAYKASLKPAYDQESTDKAIKAFSEFSADNKDLQLTQEADKTIQRLKDKAAEKSLQTAQFYEKINKKESAIIYYKDIINRYPDCSYIALANTRIEELKTGKKKANIVTAQAPKGGFFGLWGAKAGAEPAAVKPEDVAPESLQAASVSGEQQAPAKKGWMPFSFGKKDKAAREKEVKSAEATASMPKKWSWSPLNFNKKEEAGPTAGEEKAQAVGPAPVAGSTVAQESQIPVQAPKEAEDPWAIPEDSQQIGAQSVPPVNEPVPTSSSAQPTPAVSSGVSQPVSTAVSTPVSSAQIAAPAAQKAQPQAPCQPAAPYRPKKKGWNLVDILGFGSDSSQPEKPAKTEPRSPNAPPVAEPLPNATAPAASTDDPNLDKDDYIY